MSTKPTFAKTTNGACRAGVANDGQKLARLYARSSSFSSSQSKCRGKRCTSGTCCTKASSSSKDEASSTNVRYEGTALPTLLNNIPHTREIRRFFYDDATESVLRAIKDDRNVRMKVFTEFPEMNVEGDVFRAGTLLEMVRTMATELARMERKDGSGGKQRVKLCVQGSMGTGVFQGLPLALSGISRLIDLMDWEEDVAERISNGAIGKDHAKDDEDVFILICPQNIVGYSILPYMEEMMEVAGNRPMILLNPKLGDIQSAGNVMSIRGRQGRMEFANSWEEIYHFRLLYRKPFFFPIYGALRKSYSSAEEDDTWELYKRFGKMDDEYYQLMEVYEKEPNPDQMTKVIWGKR